MNLHSAIGRLAILIPLVLLLGCASAAATAPPSTPAGTSPSLPHVSPPTSVGSATDAAAAVFAANPQLAALEPFDANKIGQCCFYRATQTADGWTVTAQVGWGDCPSGCVNRHTWTFAVDASGNVTPTAETGPAVPAGVLPVAPAGSGGGGSLSGSGIEGVATAGPVCPVEKPNDPACAGRPVAGATIHVLAADGTEVATLTTDASGRFAASLDPGAYRLVADPVAGLMRAPGPLDVTVGGAPVAVTLSYDTGIR